MSAPTRCVWTPAQVRALDRTAIDEFGIPGYELMCRAGEAAFATARALHAGRWLVLCGPGNNAGDGYVLARLARAAGEDVVVAALSDPDALKGDAGRAWIDYRENGGEVVRWSPALLTGAGLVVDGLFGTGLTRPVGTPYREVIEAVNGSGRTVLALDVPSGLDGTTGMPLGIAVRADVTVTFVGRKLGLYVGDGPSHAGRVEFADLGLPVSIIDRTPSCSIAPLRLFAEDDLQALLPPRRATAHKGEFGHVLVIGGNDGMFGAVRLAGEAALRSGAGLVSVATRPGNAMAIPPVRPELMCRGIAGARDLEDSLLAASVVAIGPGLGQDGWAREMLEAALASERPLVVDADALNLLALMPVRRPDWILTPHPGEAGRLLGISTATVQADRLYAVGALAEKFGGTIVLKGRGTVVAAKDTIPWVIDRGNAGMATAGMGDVLTGIIAALVAQLHSTAPAAAAAGAFVHAAAGDDAALAGERGLLASDLFSTLRRWLNPAPLR